MPGHETSAVTWVLEAGIFSESDAPLCDAVVAAGHDLVVWRDDWLENGRWPHLTDRAVVFHGSLGNADYIAKTFQWRPGAFCNTEAFHCSSWYPRARPWLLHRSWSKMTLAELVSNPLSALRSLGVPELVFVRPDSPLKPFSGRVVRRDAISLEAFDYGFYFDDETLPVIVTPVRSIQREWRYVVVNGEVVAGSAYDAHRRTALGDEASGEPWRFADGLAKELQPENVYVLDVCQADGGLHLLELNPFSGADLYACDRAAVVSAVSRFASTAFGPTANGD